MLSRSGLHLINRSLSSEFKRLELIYRQTNDLFSFQSRQVKEYTDMFRVLLACLAILVTGVLGSDSQPTCPAPYSTCPQGKEGAINVHIIAHSHDDVGWLATVDEYYYGKQITGVQYILGRVSHDFFYKLLFT